MCRLLSDWSPSSSAIELIELSDMDDEQIAASLACVKNQTALSDMVDTDGHHYWNAFFIMSSINAVNKPIN
jgi:hypothetical protein